MHNGDVRLAIAEQEVDERSSPRPVEGGLEVLWDSETAPPELARGRSVACMKGSNLQARIVGTAAFASMRGANIDARIAGMTAFPRQAASQDNRSPAAKAGER